jgi:hypothetical protein
MACSAGKEKEEDAKAPDNTQCNSARVASADDKQRGEEHVSLSGALRSVVLYFLGES